MAIKRVVSTEFWNDEKVINEFTPEDKYFFLYLLTNPRTTLLGIYRFVPKQAAFEMGYSVDAVNVLLERFERKYGIIRYNKDTSEVAIRNYLRHGIVSGGKPIYDRLEQDSLAVKDKTLLAFVAEANTNNPNDTVKQFISSLSPVPPNSLNGNGNGESYHDSYHDSCHDSLEVNFNAFWEAYPRKVGKAAARKAYAKVPCSVRPETILEAIGGQKMTEQWQKEGGRFIPHPATWLNQGRWEDEIPEQKDEGAWEAWKRS